MAKAPAKSRTPRKKAASKKTGGSRSDSGPAVSAEGKQLVIVESPAKAKTINKYLGSGYLVKASVGHVRDLPTKAKKGEKSPVPGVDLDHDFKPHYEVLPGKTKTMSELKRAAKQASEVWFATDLDREGEAIAWHLAQELGIDPSKAKRVVFNAITEAEIKRAFSTPHAIDVNKVNAQQARRVLDRIVGYQVSPLLWKKVARGLSAGRVQSVAVRLIVEREREIRAFTPDEYWALTARFTLDQASAQRLLAEWPKFLATPVQKGDKSDPPTVKAQNAWLAERNAITAELVDIAGESFDKDSQIKSKTKDLGAALRTVAEAAGLKNIKVAERKDPKGKGPAANLRTMTGEADPATPYTISSIETKRTSSRPGAPFITSTLQQAGSTRLGFAAQRTMRAAQALYEGVDVKGVGAVGLITYMRTDSTHLSKEAIEMARGFIQQRYGEKYLPEKPNFFSSSNKAAQEAHEAIRPTNADLTPERVKDALTADQLRVYKLIWERFVSSQMTPAQWDSTTVLIKGGADAKRPLTFKATGRTLVFDGYMRVSGVPVASDEQTLPGLKEGARAHPFAIEPEQKFTTPPSRYSEASLIKTLESEGIGRPSTYAAIIQTIQDRAYVEQIARAFYATDLGEVVTDKLVEAFPEIMEVGYTKDLEAELDKIEDDHLDWVEVLQAFYGPFKIKLDTAHEELKHAKAETTPAPKEYKCEKCGAGLVYRFGKNGRFLSCSTYPACDYACPCDREGKPQKVETADIMCPNCGKPMTKRNGRFGPFFGCSGYPECSTILKADKKGRVLAPQPPPLMTDIECPKCKERQLALRNGARGPWLSCSGYPKCRGRGKWSELPEDVRAKWEKALAEHEKQHPIPIIRNAKGQALTDAKGKPLDRDDAKAAPAAGGASDEADYDSESAAA